ncbi:hypothetical protein ACLOJK_032362 [Asimina triloba]
MGVGIIGDPFRVLKSLIRLYQWRLEARTDAERTARATTSPPPMAQVKGQVVLSQKESLLMGPRGHHPLDGYGHKGDGMHSDGPSSMHPLATIHGLLLLRMHVKQQDDDEDEMKMATSTRAYVAFYASSHREKPTQIRSDGFFLTRHVVACAGTRLQRRIVLAAVVSLVTIAVFVSVRPSSLSPSIVCSSSPCPSSPPSLLLLRLRLRLRFHLCPSPSPSCISPSQTTLPLNPSSSLPPLSLLSGGHLRTGTPTALAN